MIGQDGMQHLRPYNFTSWDLSKIVDSWHIEVLCIFFNTNRWSWFEIHRNYLKGKGLKTMIYRYDFCIWASGDSLAKTIWLVSSIKIFTIVGWLPSRNEPWIEWFLLRKGHQCICSLFLIGIGDILDLKHSILPLGIIRKLYMPNS